MDMQRIRNIKKWHTIISFFTFWSMLIYGIFKIDLHITTRTLSNFGAHQETNGFWILSILIISAAVMINSISYIFEYDLKYKKLTGLLFTLSTIGLIGVALMNMKDYANLHNLFASIFFILYPISIFITGMQIMKSDFRIGMASIMISILMVFSFFWLLIQIQSLPEISFLLLSFLWNFIIIYSTEFKNLFKLIGF